MALAAAQVIDTLAARLAPLPASAGRVYTSRTWPLAEDQFPAWRVTAEDESVTPLVMHGRGPNAHELEVVASGYVRAVQDLDDALHDLAAAGLAALCAHPVPYQLQLNRIERELGVEGEAAVGVITLRFTCKFNVNPAAPETIL